MCDCLWEDRVWPTALCKLPLGAGSSWALGEGQVCMGHWPPGTSHPAFLSYLTGPARPGQSPEHHSATPVQHAPGFRPCELPPRTGGSIRRLRPHSGISVLTRGERPELTRSLPHDDMARRQPSANQEEFPPEPDHAGPLSHTPSLQNCVKSMSVV